MQERNEFELDSMAPSGRVDGAILSMTGKIVHLHATTHWYTAVTGELEWLFIAGYSSPTRNQGVVTMDSIHDAFRNFAIHSQG